MLKLIVWIVLATILVAPTIALGQLSRADIDSLRQIGQQEGWTFEMGENEATSRPLKELCGMKPPTERPPGKVMTPTFTSQNFPESWDWRDLDGVTPVKNQLSCGSCWAFATVGALECNIRIVDVVTVNISEEHLVNCNLHGYGCDGGWWVHSYHLPYSHPGADACQCGGNGPVMEAEIPYTGRDLPCVCPHTHAQEYCISDWGYVAEEWAVPPVDYMKEAIMRYGPISVAIYAGNEFQSYSGGVFNACFDLPINHAVVLVGWDDTMGESGVWILRNSWGPGWGEDGYMYIEYYCCRVGFNATYVEYGIPYLVFGADTTAGKVPLEVDFDAFVTHDEIDSWSWDFGDGGTASVQNPTHIFDQRGMFDVTVQAVAGEDVYSESREFYIVAYDDTVRSHDALGLPGSQVVVTLSTFNSAPVSYFKIPVEFGGGDFDIKYDSFSTVGCRTDYFEIQDYLQYDPWYYKRMTLRLISSYGDSSPELASGEGAIVKLYFTIPSLATEGQSVSILMDGYSDYVPQFQGSRATYQVPAHDFVITCTEDCCQHRGDVDRSGSVDNGDVVYIVDWAFSSGPPPPCADEAEVNGVEGVDIDDLLYLIDYVHNGGPAPAACSQ